MILLQITGEPLTAFRNSVDSTVVVPFMFWVNITDYKSGNIRESSMLFGMDYINQGKKWFDESDDFHILFDQGLKFNTGDIGAALMQNREIAYLDFIEARFSTF